MSAVSRPRILISNGFDRFPLAHLAAGLRQRGWDVELLTGAYPSRLVAAVLRHVPGVGAYSLGRFPDRRVDIESERVHPDFASELVYKSGRVLDSAGANRLGWMLEEAGFRLAGARASRRLKELGPVDAYHVRSAFGLGSLGTARRQGIPTICDHSTVHPAALRPLFANRGRLPTGGIRKELVGLERLMVYDLESADWVLVNSDFVRETFEWAGFDTARVKVIYAGVEPEFIAAVPSSDAGPRNGPLRLLFAGAIGYRKGADVLLRAFSGLQGVDWHLDFVGPMMADMAERRAGLLADDRVSWLGTLRTIRDVAAVMSRAEVFVFPSLAEGSARVVAQAMAAGCYVVTTRNSGSVVQDGVHGRLVPAGDDEALASVLRELPQHRGEIKAIGRANADLIRREYLVEHYAERVASFYREILGCGPRGEGLS